MSFATPKPVQSERRLAPRMPNAYYNLHDLYETLHDFAQRGEQIDRLLREMESNGDVSQKVVREVKQLLGELPLFSLEIKLESLASSLPAAAA